MSDTIENNRIARAKLIIEICGGVHVVAQIIGRAPTRVFSWTYPKEKHGTGGLIPSEAQQVLMRHARENGLPLTPSHFFPDCDVAEVAE